MLSPVADAARQVLAAALGVQVRPSTLRTLQTTAVATVLAVRPAPPTPPLVLKLVRAEARPAIDLVRTAAAMTRAARAGVPVPRVLSADASGTAGGWQHLLQEEVEGLTWRSVHPRLDPGAQQPVHAQVAAVAAALAGVRFDRVGELDDADGTAPDETTPDATDPGAVPPGAVVEALRRRARWRIGDPAALATAEALLDRTADLLATGPGPVLVHDDLHHENLLVDRAEQGWRLVAVLDWDKAWAGPAEADLARLCLWDGMTGPGFWPGYRAAVPAAPGEDERLPVHQLLWCLEHAAPTPRHRADTAALCRRFGLRPPVG